MSYKHESILGDRAYGYPEFQPLRNQEFHDREKEEPVKAEVDQMQVMFDNIFALDSRTKLPSCDVSVFMSENTSPEIKQFISQNLFRESLVSDDSNLTDGIDEDTLANLTRGVSESRSSYRDRVMEFLKKQRNDAAGASK